LFWKLALTREGSARLGSVPLRLLLLSRSEVMAAGSPPSGAACHAAGSVPLSSFCDRST
jgi:hypothetical protein